MRGNNKLLIILGVIVLAMVAFAWWNNKSKAERNKTEVKIEQLKKRTIVETVTASGRIFPEEELSISSDVSGEIVELYVEEGDTVKVGQLLVKVNPEIYKSVVERAIATANSSEASLADARSQIAQFQSNLKQAEAQILQFDAQIENAQNIYDRNQKLHKEGVISDADLQASNSSLRALKANKAAGEANVEAAQASIVSAQERSKAAGFNVESARANEKEAKNNLKRATVYAPVSGVISKLNMKKGERVVGTSQMAGTEIMRIANMSSMEVQVDVSENDVLRVKLGDTARVEVDAYVDRTFKGVVTQIANSANNTGTGISSLNTDQVTNFTVKVRLLPSSYSDILEKKKTYPFRPGMSASVEIKTNVVAGILAAPIQAVTTREDEDEEESVKEVELREVVFVFESDSVILKEVKTGIQDDSYIEIKSGLEENEEIVIGPYTAVSRKLEQGMSVKLEDKTKKKNKGKSSWKKDK